MKEYTASIRHSATTVRKLCNMQYNTFQYWKKLIGGAFSLLLIVLSVYSGLGSILSVVFLALGCFLISNLNAPARANADTIIEAFKGKYPAPTYSFFPDGFSYEEGGELIPYSSIVRLVDDQAYLYIYVSRMTSYMVDNSTVSGKKGLSGLKTFLSDKTGLDWRPPFSIFKTKVIDLLPRRRGR